MTKDGLQGAFFPGVGGAALLLCGSSGDFLCQISEKCMDVNKKNGTALEKKKEMVYNTNK